MKNTIFALLSAIFMTVVGATYAQTIMVSIPPQEYIVSEIAGKTLSVKSLLRENDNPEIYQVSAGKLRKLEKADIFFTVSVPYEHKLIEALENSNASVSIEDMGKLVTRIKFEGDHGHGHDDMDEHHHEHGHVHGTHDPHIWLSPRNVKLMTKHTYKVLAARYPENAAVYQKNYTDFATKIDKLETAVESLLSPHRGKPVVIYHPALGYLAHDFGFEQVAIQWKGKESSAKQIRAIVEKTKKANTKTIFIQQGFSQKAARSIARDLKGSVVYINPLRRNVIDGIGTIVMQLAQSFAN